MFDLFDMIPNLFGKLIDQGFAQENQDDQQTFNESMQNNAQIFNSAQAVAQRDWTERMSNTAWQRGTADMKAAGLNPMLAYSQGGSHAGSGAAASASPSSSGIAHPNNTDFSSALQVGSNVALSTAQKERTEAETDRTRAEAEEIRNRTPTHEVTREHLKQQINESVENIQKIMQDVKTGAASAAQLEQQTEQSKEMVKQIRVTVDLLHAQIPKTVQETKTGKAQEKAHLSAADRDSATEREISQRINQNLPALDAAVLRLVEAHKRLELPKAGMDAAAHSSYLGALSAVLRALNPFTGIITTK